MGSLASTAHSDMPDIKDWLIGACATLASGEVVKPPTLSYLDAMNALEIMDPAMDVGAGSAPRGKFDPHAPLCPAELVWVMDEMAAREVAWLRGWSMAQTIFSSLHYHNTLHLDVRQADGTPDPQPAAAEAACIALQAFVIVFAKAVDIAYCVMLDTKGPARDGEDVWLDAYGISVETSEAAEDVLHYAARIIPWLESKGQEWAPVAARLRFRTAWISCLLLHPAHIPSRAEFTPSSTEVPWAFDDVMPFLRQNMPFPTVPFPTHTEAWDVLFAAATQLQDVRRLGGIGLARTEMFLRSRTGTMLPVVRCLYKTVLCDSPSRDVLVDEWLVGATGEPRDVLARLDSQIDGPARSSFALWRDIVAGTLLLNLAAPLSNPARRRRSLLDLCEGWTKQATAAGRIPALAPLIPALHARALDCALAGHLLGFPLRLFGRGEARAAWWTVLVLAAARAGHTWEARLARAWAAAASGMLLLYTLAGTAAEPSLPQFVLRYKILRLIGISPGAWGLARDALDAAVTDTPSALRTAREWLLAAHDEFSGLPTELDVKAVMADIAANADKVGKLEGKVVIGQLGASGFVPLLE